MLSCLSVETELAISAITGLRGSEQGQPQGTNTRQDRERGLLELRNNFSPKRRGTKTAKCLATQLQYLCIPVEQFEPSRVKKLIVRVRRVRDVLRSQMIVVLGFTKSIYKLKMCGKPRVRDHTIVCGRIIRYTKPLFS